ncbi:MAG: OmpA family protein [Ekhidna sp.]|nr:OmpA family protein [Ekhidna sp.]
MEDITPNTQIHPNSLRLIFSLFLLITSFLVFSQKFSTSNKKAIKLYEKADKKYKERDFQTAMLLLEKGGELDHTFSEAFIRMGSIYNTLGQIDSAYSKFGQYLKVSSNPVLSVLEKMAFMAFDRGDYNRSIDYLEKFLKSVPEKRIEREIQLLLKSQDFALSQVNNPDTIKIVELPIEVNSFGLQYLPTMTVDQETLIYTKRDFAADDEDIVVSHKSDGKWSKAASVSPKINTPLNEGASTVSADGRIMIFTACDRRDSFGSCDLFITRKTGNNWSKPENLGKAVNSKYWESQPSLSADGKTLYFVSNRPGGYGGRDIWFTEKKEGQWDKPKNLGSVINTFKDETTPFIHFNGESLFFSSDGYPGMGGFDLFQTVKKETSWSQPANLGYPINSFRDEVALLVSSDATKGLFARERQKEREILDSKIVSFTIPASIQPAKSSYIKGIVISEKEKSPLKASIQVYDLHSAEVLYENNSDSLTGEFYMVLPVNKQLGGYVKKKGYLYKDFSFTTDNKELDSLIIQLSSVEAGKSLILRNIYFETNSYSLDKKSKVEIENAVSLLKENPNINFMIEGHTDDIGGTAYNLDLSEKRAEEVYRNIINKGISESRLKYEGFGASSPIFPNNSEINRKFNRRIEFRVMQAKH